MRTRRLVLIAAVIPVVFSAVRRVDASDPALDADLVGYGGTSSGGWACGPSARVRYAGAAANALIAERRSASGHVEGIFGMVGAAADHEAVTLFRNTCEYPGACPDDSIPTRFLYGMHARIGYAEPTFAIQGGVTRFQAWNAPISTEPSFGWFPEIELRIGNLDGPTASPVSEPPPPR